jgi:FlaA1/EpsC-like NDP-sugar epimerase
VLGTDNAVEASLAAGVERFVLISTDKAADPSSVLGASKLMAERVVLDAAGGSMNVASVRFGNVLGSRGSLLDTLRWQLVNGLPIQITDPAVSRFFMSIPEAVGLVLEAGAMADAGETYVLDMGEPVRIMDIVERLARLMQIEVGEVTFSGLRAGEKLHEVLFAPGEMAAPTRHARIRVSRRAMEVSSSGAILRQRLSQLYRLAYKDDDVHTRQMLTVLARDESAAPCRTLAAV